MKHSILFLTSLLVTSASIISANPTEVEATQTTTNARIAKAIGIATKASLVLLPFAIEPNYFTASFTVGTVTGLIAPANDTIRSRIIGATAATASLVAQPIGRLIGSVMPGAELNKIERANNGAAIGRAFSTIPAAVMGIFSSARIISQVGDAAERATFNMLEKRSASNQSN
jgi:hypothetical protein